MRPPVARHHPQTRALRARPRLHAPAPGWSISADVVVVGSGVAGLTAALRCEAAGLTT
ncbi:FAD-binding protein, partial [Streptomyces sp. NPDC006356]